VPRVKTHPVGGREPALEHARRWRGNVSVGEEDEVVEQHERHQRSGRDAHGEAGAPSRRHAELAYQESWSQGRTSPGRAAIYRALADTLVLAHLAFVLFVVGGGLLVLKWPRVAWAHVPAAAWGVLVECSGWLCPLTPLEAWLRVQAGEVHYAGGFIEHYIM